LDAVLKAYRLIPENRKGCAFDYGIRTTNTEEGDRSLIVAATHAGVLNSKIQQNKDDTIRHNHFVSLTKDATNKDKKATK
jgi:hypothetical protein